MSLQKCCYQIICTTPLLFDKLLKFPQFHNILRIKTYLRIVPQKSVGCKHKWHPRYLDNQCTTNVIPKLSCSLSNVVLDLLCRKCSLSILSCFYLSDNFFNLIISYRKLHNNMKIPTYLGGDELFMKLYLISYP